MRCLVDCLHGLTERESLLGAPRGKVFLDSSLNQKMGPRDCNFFLREESDEGGVWKVLVDREGPGCVSRIWMAGDAENGDVEFFLDDGEQPFLRTTWRELFGGGLYPFIKPLVMDTVDSSNGRVCYFPIPFARRIKIRARQNSPSFYWQVNTIIFDEELRSLSLPLSQEEREVLEATAAHWRGAGGDPSDEEAPEKAFSFSPGESRAVLQREGAGKITALSFLLDRSGGDEEDLFLDFFWDGEETPSVSLPFLHFFAQGSKAKDFSSLFLARKGGLFLCRIVMPFARGAAVVLRNGGSQSCSGRAGWRVAESDGKDPFRFYAAYRKESFKYGTIFKALELGGAGRFFGMNLITEEQGGQTSDINFVQEGNEYAYVDGELNPSWLGTGTEDYFNCAYYYRYGEVATPTHGCLHLRTAADSYQPGFGEAELVDHRDGKVAAYRFHLLDAIPFRSQLVLLLEAGCPKKGALAGVNGRDDLLYRWTCYWYGEPDRASLTPARRDLTL